MSTWKKKLQSVDWGSLQHAYGSARNVPKLMKKVAKGDEVACDELEYSVLHQGMLCRAAVPVIEVAVAMIADGVDPELPMTLIQTAAKAAFDDDDDEGAAEAMRAVLRDSLPVLAELITAGGDQAVVAVELVPLMGTPSPELIATLNQALETPGDLAWAAAKTLGRFNLLPDDADPSHRVPAALGRFAAGTATPDDVALVAAHQELVEEHEFVAWLGDVPLGPDVLAAFTPTQNVMIGLLEAADRHRSHTLTAIRQVIDGTRDDALPADDAATLLLRLPRTPEVLDALDAVGARANDPGDGWSHPRASIAHTLAVARDPRWEPHLVETLRWALQQGEDLADEDLYVATAPGVGTPVGLAFEEIGAVPGPELARVVGELLSSCDPDDEKFTFSILAHWVATWPEALQHPLRADARRWDPLNPHWADSEADLEHIREASDDADDLVRLARHTGELADWEAALEASAEDFDDTLDADFPQRDHPKLIAWWQGLLADEDSDETEVAACLRGMVAAGAIPLEQAWPRVVELLTLDNYSAGSAARLVAQWSDQLDDDQRATAVTRLTTLVRDAEYDQAECASCLLHLGAAWPLTAEETSHLVVEELREGYRGPAVGVELCGLLRDREPVIATQVAAELRTLQAADTRLAPSILEDERKQHELQQYLAALGQETAG